MSKKTDSGTEGAGKGNGKKSSPSTGSRKKKTTSRKTSKKVSSDEEAAAEAPEEEAVSEAPEEAAATPEVEAPGEPAADPEASSAPAIEAPISTAKAAAEPDAVAYEDVEEAGLGGALMDLARAAGAWLWSTRRRPYTIAIGAALLLIVGWQFGGDEVEAVEGAREVPVAEVGEQSLAEEARLQIAAGDPLGAARRLEPEVTRTDRKGGDAHLHAALAHAYAQAGWGADAVPHFEWTARKDPAALRDEDLLDLVRLLGLPGSNSEGVQATLITAGRRSVPFLEAAWEDESAPVLVRRRSGEVLQRLGEDLSLVETYRGLLERGACPARKEAVARLAAATDDRAVDLLEEVAASGRCGAAEAKRALGD